MKNIIISAILPIVKFAKLIDEFLQKLELQAKKKILTLKDLVQKKVKFISNYTSCHKKADSGDFRVKTEFRIA